MPGSLLSPRRGERRRGKFDDRIPGLAVYRFAGRVLLRLGKSHELDLAAAGLVTWSGCGAPKRAIGLQEAGLAVVGQRNRQHLANQSLAQHAVLHGDGQLDAPEEVARAT